MGRFFSNIQIKNSQENREQFIEEFNKAMKKRELIPATEDDASHTYILAFSENNEWITLCYADYESGGEDVKEDVQFFAESLKTCCISTSVVDSDCAILEMYNTTSAMADMVLVGDGSGYGFEDDTEFKGKKEAWDSLLTESNTWEQLSEIWNGDYVFTEEALSKMAPVLGMDSQNIISDYDDLSSRTDKNIMELHFKKKGKKALSLNAAFIQVFGEALEPLGFKKIKGKYPYFVRVVEGGDIIHVIAYRNEDPDHISEKSFNILGGVATIYRNDIDLTIKPYDNDYWLENNHSLYYRSHTDRGDKFRESIYKFSYKSDSEESMLSEVKRSLDVTKQIMLPFLDKIVDIDACIRHFLILPGLILGFGEIFEGLLYLKTDNYADIIEENIRRHQLIYEHNVKLQRRGYTQEELERQLQRHEEVKNREIAPIEEVLTNPKLYAEYTEKLECRKSANIEMLKSYGLNL